MPPQIFLPLLSRVKTHIETSQNTTYESSCTLSRNCLVNSWRLFVSYKTSLFFSCLSDKYALLKRIKLFFKSNNSIYIHQSTQFLFILFLRIHSNVNCHYWIFSNPSNSKALSLFESTCNVTHLHWFNMQLRQCGPIDPIKLFELSIKISVHCHVNRHLAPD